MTVRTPRPARYRSPRPRRQGVRGPRVEHPRHASIDRPPLLSRPPPVGAACRRAAVGGRCPGVRPAGPVGRPVRRRHHARGRGGRGARRRRAPHPRVPARDRRGRHAGHPRALAVLQRPAAGRRHPLAGPRGVLHPEGLHRRAVGPPRHRQLRGLRRAGRPQPGQGLRHPRRALRRPAVVVGEGRVLRQVLRRRDPTRRCRPGPAWPRDHGQRRRHRRAVRRGVLRRGAAGAQRSAVGDGLRAVRPRRARRRRRHAPPVRATHLPARELRQRRRPARRHDRLLGRARVPRRCRRHHRVDADGHRPAGLHRLPDQPRRVVRRDPHLPSGDHRPVAAQVPLRRGRPDRAR